MIDTEKEYIIPTGITLDKMDKLLAKMSKSDATRAGEYYKKYDTNKLGKKDNKEELLANYPILETEKAYILRSTTKDNIKVKLEQYFADAGNFLNDKEKASIGMLQRVFKIGFNRAARIMDQLEEVGVVGPEEGTKPRRVLMTKEEFEQLLEEKS